MHGVRVPVWQTQSAGHTTQHGAVLIIFPLNLQTVTITRMLSSRWERGLTLTINKCGWKNDFARLRRKRYRCRCVRAGTFKTTSRTTKHRWRNWTRRVSSSSSNNKRISKRISINSRRASCPQEQPSRRHRSTTPCARSATRPSSLTASATSVTTADCGPVRAAEVRRRSAPTRCVQK